MTQEELNQITYASHEIIKLSEDLLTKLEANNATIEEKRVSNGATSTVINDVSGVLNQLIGEIQMGTDTPEQKLSKVAEFLKSFVSSLQSAQKAADDDLIRLTATQEGMRRALEAVRETGNLRIQEVQRIEKLAQQEDPEARRPVGARPETVATKRNAKSLKQSQVEGDN